MRTISDGVTQRCAPIGFADVHVSFSSRFSVSGSRAMSSSPPAASGVATPAAASFSRYSGERSMR
jgi:hypothetical protein